jgi:choline-sulfatase
MSDLTRRSLLRAGSLALASAGASNAAPERPNILFICSDQHTASALGSNGHPVVKTPHLDRLAANGVSFRNAYSGNPVCAPGRACMMTGKFASDVGSYCNSTPFDGHVPSWGNRLRDAGYYCWATGKMDLWRKKDFGFHEIGTQHGHCEGPDITSLFRSPVCFRPDERRNVNGWFEERDSPDKPKAENAMKFLRDESRKLGKPWCMYVGYTKPHPKWIADARYEKIYPAAQMPLPRWPDGYLEKRHDAFQVLANFKNVQVPFPTERVRRARSAYYGMVTEVDEMVGVVLDELDRTGQREKTLIIYTSDHGEMLGEHGLWLKNTLLEGAARVPLIFSGPGMPKGKTIETPVSHVDMVATMMELGGAATDGLRGHSLAPMAHGQASSHPGFAYSESHSEGNCTGSFMIRKGDWKYLYFTGGEPLLFQMKDEMGEFVNLARDKKLADVRKELHGHLTSLVDPDAVTQAGFRKQENMLAERVKSMSAADFYDDLVGRLGSMQARMLTYRYYNKTV